MKKTLLFIFVLLQIQASAAPRYTENCEGYTSGISIDSQEVGQANPYWVLDFQNPGGSATVETNAGFSSDVFRLDGNGSLWALASNTNTAYADMIFQARIDSNRCAICIRHDGQNNGAGQPTTGYCLEYIHALTLLRVMECTFAGMASVLVQDNSFTVADVNDYTLALEGIGTELKAYVDGVEELSTTDNTFDLGGFGLLTIGIADYDDLLVDDQGRQNPNNDIHFNLKFQTVNPFGFLTTPLYAKQPGVDRKMGPQRSVRNSLYRTSRHIINRAKDRYRRSAAIKAGTIVLTPTRTKTPGLAPISTATPSATPTPNVVKESLKVFR